MSFPSTTLIAKWEQITTDAIDACEHKVDKLDIAFTLDALEVKADSLFKILEISGSEFDICWFKKKYFKSFKTSFVDEFPGYKFKLIEENKQ